MKIGIGITTHNRPKIFKQTYDKIKEFLPNGAKLVVVDDCSDIPVQEATFRFDVNVGIAKAKNKCFELLEGCDYVYLFDDDVFPLVKNWHLPYVASGVNHAMMIFPKLSDGTNTNNKLLKKIGDLNYFAHPCGCMLFYTKKCLDIVGGMDERFGKWGYDHVQLSMRIFNNGLIPYPFLDVNNSLELFYSHDFHQTCERSVDSSTRKKHIKSGAPIYESSKNSKEFIPYREMTGRIITIYFTGVEDPQQGGKWEPNVNDISPLVGSIVNASEATIPTTVLQNCWNEFGQNMSWFKPTKCTMNPYLQRWVSYLEYLKEVKEDYVFCVDSTDVQMINNPFKENLGNYLWVGDEPGTIKNEWLLKHHNVPLFKDFFRKHASFPLLNAGVIGGRKSIVEAFIKRMVWYIENEGVGNTDMGLFNYVLYTEFREQIKHGRRVTNVFKSYKTTGTEFFKHK